MEEQTPMHTPSLLTFNSPSILTQTSNLYDRYELRSVTSRLGQALTPTWSPSVPAGAGRSNLFDSCELDAVVRQLNGALRATKHGTMIYPSETKGTGAKHGTMIYSLETKGTGCFEKKSGKKPTKMLWGPIVAEGSGSNGRGHAPSLWKKVKGAILGPLNFHL